MVLLLLGVANPARPYQLTLPPCRQQQFISTLKATTAWCWLLRPGKIYFLTCVGGIEAIAEGRRRYRLSSPLRAAVVGVRGGGLPGSSGHRCVVGAGSCERSGDNRWARIRTGKLGSEVISAAGGGGDGRRRSRSWRGSNIEGVEIYMRCIYRKL